MNKYLQYHNFIILITCSFFLFIGCESVLENNPNETQLANSTLSLVPSCNNQNLGIPVASGSISSSRPKVTWNSIPGAASYRIKRHSTSHPSIPIYTTFTSSSTSFIDNTLPFPAILQDRLHTGKEFLYRVSAIDGSGCSGSAGTSVVFKEDE